MHSNTGSIRGSAPDGRVVRDRVVRLSEVVRQMDGLAAELVELTAELRRGGVAERVAGLTVEGLLAAEAGLTGRDRWLWVLAGEVLERMPVLAGLFRDRRLGWSVVREIVLQVRGLTVAQQAEVDARLAATLRAGRLRGDPDALVDAVEQAADDARLQASIERREQRREQAEVVIAQSDFEGGSTGYWRLGPVATAALMNALNAAADPPVRAEEDTSAGAGPADSGRADGGSMGSGESGDGAGTDADPDGLDVDGGSDAPAPVGRGRGRQLAVGLRRVCEAYLGGGSGGRARPSVHVIVDARERAHTHTPGLVVPVLPGPAGRLTARAVADLLDGGATVRAIAFDDGTPVMVSRPWRHGGRRTVSGIASASRSDPDTDKQNALRGVTAAPRLRAHVVDALARHAEHIARDGGAAGRPSLLAPSLVRAVDVSGRTRTAVLVRDRGCRFPACRAPASWCDVHHASPRAAGGDHHPDNVVLLCRRHHRLVHRGGWRLTVQATAEVVARNGAHRWAAWPCGTSLVVARSGPSPPLADVARRAHT